MNNNNTFNSSPIILDSSSSTKDIYSDMLYPSYFNNHSYIQCELEEDEDDMMMPVPQHLDIEQINYEFPPKSHLKALAYLDQLEEEYSFFDETSFTTATLSTNDDISSTTSSSLSGYFNSTTTKNTNNMTLSTCFSSLIDDQEEKDLDYTHSNQQHHEIPHHLIDDHYLSPLQLPAQVSKQNHERIQSSDSILTIIHSKNNNSLVAPQSYLENNNNEDNDENLSYFDHHACQVVTLSDPNLYQQHGMLSPPTLSRLNSLESLDLPIYINETEPILDDNEQDDDVYSINSDCLDQHLFNQKQQLKQQNVVLIKLNKLGNKKLLINNSASRYPGSLMGSDEGYQDEDEEEQQKQQLYEIESASVFLPLDENEEQMHSAFNYHQQQWIQRIEVLENQLKEEKAMREAFEKAMEDMTILMDQQQKVLYDRLEQEIQMRQTYEQKMIQTLSFIKPLEQQLEKETKSRLQLENTMDHVLDQINSLKQQQQSQIEDDSQKRKRLQKKLDQALLDIDQLQQQSNTTTMAGTTVVSSPSLSSSTTSSINNNKQTTTATKSRRTITPSKPINTKSNNNHSTINTNNTTVRSNVTSTTTTTNKTILKTNNNNRASSTVRPSKFNIVDQNKSTVRSFKQHPSSTVATTTNTTSKRIILHQ